MQRTCLFLFVLIFGLAKSAVATEPLFDFGFDPLPWTGCGSYRCMTLVAWDEVNGVHLPADLTQARGSEPGGSVLNVFGDDPAGTNIIAMGNEGIGGAAVTRDIFHELGDQSEMTWSGWFRSADDETWGNGASLLSIPGHVEIRGGSGAVRWWNGLSALADGTRRSDRSNNASA